jgi:hypothetical protein
MREERDIVDGHHGRRRRGERRGVAGREHDVRTIAAERPLEIPLLPLRAAGTGDDADVGRQAGRHIVVSRRVEL